MKKLGTTSEIRLSPKWKRAVAISTGLKLPQVRKIISYLIIDQPLLIERRRVGKFQIAFSSFCAGNVIFVLGVHLVTGTNAFLAQR